MDLELGERLPLAACAEVNWEALRHPLNVCASEGEEVIGVLQKTSCNILGDCGAVEKLMWFCRSSRCDLENSCDARLQVAGPIIFRACEIRLFLLCRFCTQCLVIVMLFVLPRFSVLRLCPEVNYCSRIRACTL
jgi:hypothetical protein